MGNLISWLQDNLPPLEKDERIGEAREQNQPPSVSNMVSTLVPAAILSAVYIVLFLFFRTSQRRFYAPRTFLGSLEDKERTPELPTGLLNWIYAFWKIPDVYALQHQSLDAYLFVRFLRVCTVMTTVCMIITWAVLFPVHATASNGKSQLEMISYGNINLDTDTNRLYAHTFVGWIIYGFIMYMVTRECIFYITLRQAYLLAPQNATRISSRTVLFTAVPDSLLNEAELREVFDKEVIEHIWIAGDSQDIDKIVEERDNAAIALEKALVGEATKRRTKNTKDCGTAVLDNLRLCCGRSPVGNTIGWARSQLEALIPEAEAKQKLYKAGPAKQKHSVFIAFRSQSEAQAAFQYVTHHHALHMSPRYIGVKPEEIIWNNLDIPWWQRIIRRYLVCLLTAVLIIFWAVPVGIVGMICQVDNIKQLRGLTWIEQIPDIILGIISGLLPSIALTVLMSTVPALIRLLAVLGGEVSLPQVELFTQNAYFCFQLIQVFLIRTLTDTASTTILQIIKSPSAIFKILSHAISTSSNFYVSYFIVQGFTMATNILAQVVGFATFNLMYRYLADTPRNKYNRWTTLSDISWGSILPVYTTITVVSITYAVIAPLTLLWAAIALALFYLAYRYNVLFVTDTHIDTRGLFYPRALQHLFFGIYLAEICMVGTFIVSKAPGPATLTAIFLVFTLLYHIALNRSLRPLLHSLPRTLQKREQNAARDSHHSDAADDHKPGLLTHFLKPWVIADYEVLRKLIPRDGAVEYDKKTVMDAYFPPSVKSPKPILWLPLRCRGLFQSELTERIIEIKYHDWDPQNMESVPPSMKPLKIRF